jgi:hypothetical protein
MAAGTAVTTRPTGQDGGVAGKPGHREAGIPGVRPP